MRIKYILLSACLVLISVAAGNVSATPEIQSWDTKQGAKVYFVESQMLPMVDVRIVFDAAGSRDGALPGLAMLTNGLLAEGAAGKGGAEIRPGHRNLRAARDGAVRRSDAQDLRWRTKGEGPCQEVAAQLQADFHPDDRLMLWFDFFNHDCARVIQNMEAFMQQVVPRIEEATQT